MTDNSMEYNTPQIELLEFFPERFIATSGDFVDYETENLDW